MNTTDEGFSFSFHKNYKLSPTYPRLAIFSLRELHQTSPSALRGERSSRYQSDPPENQIWHTDEAGASLTCYQSTLISETSFFSQWYFPSSRRSTNEFYQRSLQALLSSAPHCSRVLTRLASLAQIGELAHRLSQHFFTCTHLDTRMNIINPLSPKSDQHQISPCNINAW